jgi:hypothetical protein
MRLKCNPLVLTVGADIGAGIYHGPANVEDGHRLWPRRGGGKWGRVSATLFTASMSMAE